MACMFSKSLDRCLFFLSGVRNKNENSLLQCAKCSQSHYCLIFTSRGKQVRHCYHHHPLYRWGNWGSGEVIFLKEKAEVGISLWSLDFEYQYVETWKPIRQGVMERPERMARGSKGLSSTIRIQDGALFWVLDQPSSNKRQVGMGKFHQRKCCFEKE